MEDKEERTGTIVVPNDVFFAHVCESLAGGLSVTFTVKGYSMFPFLRNEKDRVCLKPSDGNGLQTGDVILFRYHGRYILHRIYSVEKTHDGCPLYKTMGDGNVKGTEHARPEDIAALREEMGLDDPFFVRYGRVAFFFKLVIPQLFQRLLAKLAVNVGQLGALVFHNGKVHVGLIQLFVLGGGGNQFFARNNLQQILPADRRLGESAGVV